MASGLVLVDDDGRILAGMGPAGDLGGLATAAIDVAWQRATPANMPKVGASYDVTARAVATRDGMLYFGALGTRKLKRPTSNGLPWPGRPVTGIAPAAPMVGTYVTVPRARP